MLTRKVAAARGHLVTRLMNCCRWASPRRMDHVPVPLSPTLWCLKCGFSGDCRLIDFRLEYGRALISHNYWQFEHLRDLRNRNESHEQGRRRNNMWPTVLFTNTFFSTLFSTFFSTFFFTFFFTCFSTLFSY